MVKTFTRATLPNHEFNPTARSVFQRTMGLCAICRIVPILAMAFDLSNAQIFSNGLVGYYPFDGNADDGSGYGNHANVEGAVLTKDRFGEERKAYSFHDSSVIRIPRMVHAPKFYDSSFTLSFWMRSGSSKRMYAFSVDPADGNSENLNIEFNDAFGSWVYWNSGGAHAITVGKINQYTTGEWRHVLIRRDHAQGRLDLFLDGDSLGSTPVPSGTTIGSNDSEMRIGSSGWFGNAAFGWKGEMDDIALYNRSLSNKEIRVLARNGLIAYYPFESGPYDESGNNHDAVVHGASLFPGHLSEPMGSYHFDGRFEAENPSLLNSIRIPASDMPIFDNDFTLSLWFKSSVRSRMYAFSIDPDTDGKRNLDIEFNDDSGCWVYWNSQGANFIKAGAIGEFTTGNWNHLVLRRTQSSRLMELFINGVLRGSKVDSARETIGSDSTEMYLGYNANSRRAPFYRQFAWQGEIDEVAVFNRALTNKEFETLPFGDKVEVTSPNGGESWSEGSKHFITWKARPGIAYTAEYTVNDGLTWRPIQGCDSIHGNRCLWEIPYGTSDKGRIRVTADTYPGREGKSKKTFSIIPTQEKKYAWTQAYAPEHAPFEKMDGAGALTFGGRMWLLGGWNPKFPLQDAPTFNKIWSSADGIDWHAIPQDYTPGNRWEGRHMAGYVVFPDTGESRMWIIGGDNNRNHYQADIWSSKDGATWDSVTHQPFLNRTGHIVDTLNGKIWVMGGQMMTGCGFLQSMDSLYGIEGFYNDVWSSGDGRHWEKEISHAPWAPRGFMSGSAVLDGKLWILGGGTYETPSHPRRAFFQDVWNTSDGINWKRVTKYAPWKGREYHSVAVFDDRLWVIGGFDGDPNEAGCLNTNPPGRNDVWYSSDGVNWYEAASAPWHCRHATSVFVFQEALWITAGFVKDVYKLSIPKADPDSLE